MYGLFIQNIHSLKEIVSGGNTDTANSHWELNFERGVRTYVLLVLFWLVSRWIVPVPVRLQVLHQWTSIHSLSWAHTLRLQGLFKILERGICFSDVNENPHFRTNSLKNLYEQFSNLIWPGIFFFFLPVQPGIFKH